VVGVPQHNGVYKEQLLDRVVLNLVTSHGIFLLVLFAQLWVIVGHARSVTQIVIGAQPPKMELEDVCVMESSLDVPSFTTALVMIGSLVLNVALTQLANGVITVVAVVFALPIMEIVLLTLSQLILALAAQTEIVQHVKPDTTVLGVMNHLNATIREIQLLATFTKSVTLLVPHIALPLEKIALLAMNYKVVFGVPILDLVLKKILQPANDNHNVKLVTDICFAILAWMKLVANGVREEPPEMDIVELNARLDTLPLLACHIVTV